MSTEKKLGCSSTVNERAPGNLRQLALMASSPMLKMSLPVRDCAEILGSPPGEIARLEM
jgi:hypothetical protein